MFEIDQEALFRYRIVSLVEGLRCLGVGTKVAVREVCQTTHTDERNRERRISERNVYRWLRAWRNDGIEGLKRPRRAPLQGSLVLSEKLLNFVSEERSLDRDASIPELLRRAQQKGVLAPEQSVDRTTLWRCMRRMEIETSRRRLPADIDMRRFCQSARLRMVLSDFKHFRAGATRLKRAVAYFLDDHSRYGLDCACSTSEQSDLVLRLFYRILRRYGRISALYVDRGPAYIADDLALVCARLNIALIHGKARYPEGHGKVERFNRSAKARTLRSLLLPEVDADCASLTLRLRHDLHEVYNHLPHEGLKQRTPHECFFDSVQPPLRPLTEDELRAAFQIPMERLVSNDHIISVHSIPYEVPRGLRRQRITVWRHLLERDEFGREKLSVLHEGERVVLAEVDPNLNARSHRAKPANVESEVLPASESASALSFRRALQPMLAADGGYHPKPEKP